MVSQAIHLDSKSQIESFTKYMFWRYHPNVHSSKLIHDPIWGGIRLFPWEVALLDSPLLQRLRRIHQTSLAYLTYPTARHSRLEHTIGVIHIAEKIIQRINEHLKTEPQPDYRKNITPIEEYERFEIRLAALLHDIGHCLFSHISEKIYGKNCYSEDIISIKKELSFASPHEILSYLIVTSNSFLKFFNKYVCPCFPKEFDVSKLSLERIAGFIVGIHECPERTFIAEIINGPFDADKLDYILRDAYNAGISINYDIHRLLYKIDVYNDGNKVLTALPLTAVTTAKQIVFCKLMLYSYMYHHHKILACDAILKSILEEANEWVQTIEKKASSMKSSLIIKNFPQMVKKCLDGLSLRYKEKQKIKSEITNNFYKYYLNVNKRIVWLRKRDNLSYLWYTDYDVLNNFNLITNLSVPNSITQGIRRLLNRDLLMRALVIKQDSIKNFEERMKINQRRYRKLVKFVRDPIKHKQLRQQLAKAVNIQIKRDGLQLPDCREYEIWFEFPKVPPSTKLQSMPIIEKIGKDYSGNDKFTIAPIAKYFKVAEIIDTYEAREATGYLFSIKELRTIVSQTARELIKRKFHIEFDDLVVSEIESP